MDVILPPSEPCRAGVNTPPRPPRYLCCVVGVSGHSAGGHRFQGLFDLVAWHMSHCVTLNTKHCRTRSTEQCRLQGLAIQIWRSWSDNYLLNTEHGTNRASPVCGAPPAALESIDCLKAAVHWVRASAFSAESSPNLIWAAMGLRADSARRLSVRAEPLMR